MCPGDTDLKHDRDALQLLWGMVAGETLVALVHVMLHVIIPVAFSGVCWVEAAIQSTHRPGCSAAAGSVMSAVLLVAQSA
jgi:hypothetical protein